MINRIYLLAIPSVILLALAVTLILDSSEVTTFKPSIAENSPQVLPNGCYPALHLNGTYYEVCPKELEIGN